MASAAEQLAANINWSAFAKADELKKRIWFTLGALVIYRLGTYIPLPGIDPAAFEASFLGQKQGVLDMFNMFSGGAVQRMAVFALNIMPYISASIIIQLLSSVVPSLEAIKKEGEQGRKVLNQYTRYLTVILAVFQAYGISIGLEGRAGIVSDPGLLFRISTIVTLTGGTMFLVWLGEQITSRGVGNGSSLIIFAGIVARLPQAVVQLVRARSTGVHLDRVRAGRHHHGVCCRRFHRVHGARAAASADHLSAPTSRQQDVRGTEFVPATETQHVRRHSADLRLLAAACCRRPSPISLKGRRVRAFCRRSRRCSDAVVRSI